MSSYQTTHLASVQSQAIWLETFWHFPTWGIFHKRRWQAPPFISGLPHISVQISHILMRPNTSQPAIFLYLPISQGCVCLSFVCRVLPGDIPVCSCCLNSTLGLCLFLSSNKEASGVLTFTWMKGALQTKHFRTVSVKNIRCSNNHVSSFTAWYLAVWRIGKEHLSFYLFIFFKGETQVTHSTERAGNEANKAWEQGCHTHRSKGLPWVLCRVAEREREKVKKRERQRESGRDASFIEWDRICCPFSPSVNICGWLVLASELSAVREGLVLIRCDSDGKGQRGGEAGEAAWGVWAPCPTWSSTGGRMESRVWERDKGR